MKSLLSAACIIFFITGCTKKSITIINGDTDSPVINVVSPQSVLNLRAGDYLVIKAVITDNRLIQEAAWEAMNAASACGNSPYKDSFSPIDTRYEMTVNFLIPPNFSGNRLIRLYAMDNSGNISSKDVNFVATN